MSWRKKKKEKKKTDLILVRVCVCLLCTCMCCLSDTHMCVQVLEYGTQSRRWLSVAWHGCWKLNSGPMQGHRVLLISEPSLSSHAYLILTYYWCIVDSQFWFLWLYRNGSLKAPLWSFGSLDSTLHSLSWREFLKIMPGNTPSPLTTSDLNLR